MAPSKIQITAAGSSIAPCATSPQLMPFHIGYSGPAPIPTFFRVLELKEDLPSASASSSTSTGASAVTDADSAGKDESLPSKKKGNIAKRLVAAFRGRRVVGVEVPLPEGYTGLILKSDAPGEMERPRTTMNNANGAASRNSKYRRKLSTRGMRRTKPIDIDDDEQPIHEMDVDPDLTLNGGNNEGEVKTLRATQTFQSLMVWNADVAVDEGRDEYIRALREWTTVAAEVHRMED